MGGDSFGLSPLFVGRVTDHALAFGDLDWKK